MQLSMLSRNLPSVRLDWLALLCGHAAACFPAKSFKFGLHR